MNNEFLLLNKLIGWLNTSLLWRVRFPVT